MSASEWLARHLTYPAHEWLRGRPTLRESRALAKLVQQPETAVRAACTARLRALLRFAAQHLPYYAEQFARCGVNPAAEDPYAELARLPVLHKADVRANAARMTYANVPGGLQPGVSGGTSGDTLHFFLDRLRQAQSMGARFFMQAQFGVRLGDRRLWLWGSPLELKSSRVRRWRDRLLNEVLADAFDLGPRELAGHLQWMRAWQPRLLIGYTSAVVAFARYAAERTQPRDFAALRAVVLTGDEIEPQDRELVARIFGCPVVSEYGSREVGLIAHECPRGSLHVLTPHVHVEVLQDGVAAPPGTPGSIVCTNLNTRAQPFIRYHLGDVGRFAPGGCACGLPLPALVLEGARITGFVALEGGRLCHGHLVAYIVRADPCVVAFKVYQRTLTRFEILLVVDATYTPAVSERIRQAFRTYFGPRVFADVRLVNEIPPDPSGKRRHLVSDVAAEMTRFAVVAAPRAAPAAETCGAPTWSPGRPALP